MRETKPPKSPLPDRGEGRERGLTHRTDRHRPLNRTFGPAGEAPNDGAEEDATAEWLAHVQAGRIG